jgi:hypothetical protein
MYASYTFVEPPGSAAAKLDLVGLIAGFRISLDSGFLLSGVNRNNPSRRVGRILE